jgi:Fungal chitosanase of glycosyl hydrolase group 75
MIAIPYIPPLVSQRLLRGIVNLLRYAYTVTTHHLHGARHICTLPGGELYYDSKLDLDMDGSALAAQDRTGQARTALRYADGKSVDANAAPYFVLPGGFYEKHGIRKGDIAAVLYKDRIAFAVFGDVGPRHKIGEGSIALHRALGHETIHHGRLRNVGLDRDVITIVFPGSGNGTPQTPEQIAAIGKARFDILARMSFQLKSRWSAGLNQVRFT